MKQIAKSEILRQEIPNFDLQEPYCNDIWDVTEWDIYKESKTYAKRIWSMYTKEMNQAINFCLCWNPSIREETKFFLFYKLTDKKIGLYTLAEYVNKLMPLIEFTNQSQYYSVLDIETADYMKYLKDAYKMDIIFPENRIKETVSFLEAFKYAVWYDSELKKPKYERNVWQGLEYGGGKGMKIDFRKIDQPVMRQSAKDFARIKLGSSAFKNVYEIIYAVNIFCGFLYKYNKNLVSFSDVKRKEIEKCFLYLRTESGISQRGINDIIAKLSVFLEYGIVCKISGFPTVPLILPDDSCFKTVRRPKFYTDEEVASIFSLIKDIPRTYGLILLVLHHSGMRIGEILKLSIDSLKYTDGKPYLKIWMYKVKRYNNIPIDEYVHEIIKNEIMCTKKRFPDAEYVFLNSNGEPVDIIIFINFMKTIIAKNNILGSDGKPLEFKTHKFRATKATKLINMGESPERTAELLGHKSLGPLAYYAVATHQSLQEHMREYLKKESILINAIGKMDKLVIEEYKNALPLCNGWCYRPVGLGICNKVNSCLTCSQFRPSSQFLIGYKMQLLEMESSIAVAKENGYERLLEKCEKGKAALENIIMRLEEKINEQSTENGIHN